MAERQEGRKADSRLADVAAATPLAPQDAARLTEFARACKAAARAVVLYPQGHPAITATLGRIVQLTSAASLSRPLSLTVLPEGLLLDEQAPARVDSAVVELAILLHTHLIRQLTVHPGGARDPWRNFPPLLALTPQSVPTSVAVAPCY